jgi:hypothetical protein
MNEIGYILVIGYLVFSLTIQVKIIGSQLINRSQKLFNSILLWIIPFLWGLIVLGFLKPSGYGTITQGQRKISRYKFTDNWDHLTGLGGSSNDQN